MKNENSKKRERTSNKNKKMTISLAGKNNKVTKQQA